MAYGSSCAWPSRADDLPERRPRRPRRARGRVRYEIERSLEARSQNCACGIELSLSPRFTAMSRAASSIRFFIGLSAFWAWSFCAVSALSAETVHLTVDLYDPSGFAQGADLTKLTDVRASRLRADGSTSDVFLGRDLNVPIGQYRIEALVGKNPHSSLTVSLQQPEVRISLGVSLGNCCANIPGESFLGRISVRVDANAGSPAEYQVRLLPVWHNSFTISLRLDADWSAAFDPIDLGDYVIVVLRGTAVLSTKSVTLSEEGPAVDVRMPTTAD